MRQSILLFFSLFTLLVSAQIPLVYPSVWMKVDTVSGDMVCQSKSSYHYLGAKVSDSIATKEVVYENGYPMLQLSNSYYQFEGQLTNHVYMFILFREDAYAPEQALWHIHYDGTSSYSLSNHNYYQNHFSIPGYNQHEHTPKLNTRSFRLPNRINTLSLDTISLLNFDTLRFDGLFGEFLLFDTVLSNAQQQSWHSSICMKYGITMVRSNYLDSSGDTVWNYRENSNFSQGVGAVGRDDAHFFYQMQSRIFNDSITFSYDSLFVLQHEHERNAGPNQSFVFVGHQGGDVAFLGDGIRIDTVDYCRYNRIWKLLPNSFVHARKLYTRLAVSDTTGWQDYYLFFSYDSTLNSNYTAKILPRSCGENYIDFNPIMVNDGGMYFTYGYRSNECNVPEILTGENVPLVDFSDLNSGMTQRGDKFILYPNPNNGEFYIEAMLKEPDDVRLMIYDATGRVVYQQEFKHGNSYYIMPVRLPHKGAYFATMELMECKQKSQLQVIVR